MTHADFSAPNGPRLIVGGFASLDELRAANPGSLAADCDMAEIRMDLLLADGWNRRTDAWNHLGAFPLLFTARRGDEGGAGNLDAATRQDLLHSILAAARAIDIELASVEESRPLLEEIRKRGLPWIASFHDFDRLPEDTLLESKARQARDEGAACLKVAARIHSPRDMARLAEFQLADHGIPKASMGMGPLAAVSRLLCAQCGSVLNYGYLGSSPTAPGQCAAGFLKTAISSLPDC